MVNEDINQNVEELKDQLRALREEELHPVNRYRDEVRADIRKVEAELRGLLLEIRAEEDKHKSAPVIELVPLKPVEEIRVVRFPQIDGYSKKDYVPISIGDLDRAVAMADKVGLPVDLFQNVCQHVYARDKAYIDKYVTLDLERACSGLHLEDVVLTLDWTQTPSSMLSEEARRESFITYLKERGIDINSDDRVLCDYARDWVFQNRLALGYDKFVIKAAEGSSGSFVRACRKAVCFDIGRLEGATTISLSEASEIYPEIPKQELHQRLLAAGYVDVRRDNKRVMERVYE